jgi:hypothetical protein
MVRCFSVIGLATECVFPVRTKCETVELKFVLVCDYSVGVQGLHPRFQHFKASFHCSYFIIHCTKARKKLTDVAAFRVYVLTL